MKEIISNQSNDLSNEAQQMADVQMIEKIKKGFENNEFKMHLQFVMDNKKTGGGIASAEALSRWENSLGELIFPGVYIGVMEKSGLIVAFDYYMFDKVCQKLEDWNASEFGDVSISCNITRITISEKNFAEKIEEILKKYDFDRSKLIMEITEDAIERNREVARENILKMKELGLTIALDDMGSGYASLTSLLEYPIDVVKIDRAVLLRATSQKGKKLFLGLASLFNSIGLKVVCEGVETEEQNDFVAGSDCHYIQGWYYAKAMPMDKAEDFFREYMNQKVMEYEK